VVSNPRVLKTVIFGQLHPVSALIRRHIRDKLNAKFYCSHFFTYINSVVYVTLEYVKKQVREIIFKFFFLNINISVLKTRCFSQKNRDFEFASKRSRNTFTEGQAILVIFRANDEERYDKLVAQRIKAETTVTLR
jgi:membrane-bound acyltransferase YfiQ involved in biofilm formation